MLSYKRIGFKETLLRGYKMTQSLFIKQYFCQTPELSIRIRELK